MVWLGQTVLRLELSEHVVQQPGSHFGIGQSAVGATRGGQAQMPCQGAQFVVGGFGVQPACQQYGTSKRVLCGQAQALQLGLPVFAVKRRVVRHHGAVAHKPRGIAHHLRHRRRGLHHRIGDAGELRDERRYAHAGVHQALEAVHHRPVFRQHDGHLCWPVALGGRDACGFKVDDGYWVGGHVASGSVAHQRAVGQRGAALGRHVDGPGGCVAGSFGRRVGFAQHFPVTWNRLLHGDGHGFFLGVFQHQFKRGFKLVVVAVGAAHFFELGLLFVGRHVKGVAQLEAHFFVLGGVVNAVFAHKLGIASLVFFVDADDAFGQGLAQLGALLVVELDVHTHLHL